MTTQQQPNPIPAPAACWGSHWQRGAAGTTSFAAAVWPQRSQGIDLSPLSFESKSYAPQTIINCHAKKIINYAKQKHMGCPDVMRFGQLLSTAWGLGPAHRAHWQLGAISTKFTHPKSPAFCSSTQLPWATGVPTTEAHPGHREVQFP